MGDAVTKVKDCCACTGAGIALGFFSLGLSLVIAVSLVLLGFNGETAEIAAIITLIISAIFAIIALVLVVLLVFACLAGANKKKKSW
ncbi:hypothetical protein WAK64_07440 [Bacillus spongiae]|uniref:DUF4064 domain-containing protein n=1 Tax=Bacillus spongiae TaxID=2683610 RepID=A0ABU8HC37_9BACI